jgi:hypothetical protein
MSAKARDWINKRIGSNDTKTLLDEEVYPPEDLRKDKKTLQMNLQDTANDLQEHEQVYRKYLEAGMKADSEPQKKQYAQKAKFEKKKYKAKKRVHKADSIKLGTVITIEGMREVLEIQQGDEYELEAALEEVDTQELESQIIGQMADFGLELEDMKQVQEALDIEVLDDDLETDVSEELEMMQEMEADELSDEQIDLDADADDDADVDLDVDIEDDDDFDMDASVSIN